VHITAKEYLLYKHFSRLHTPENDRLMKERKNINNAAHKIEFHGG
jgi:hypothetical protein